MPNPMVDDPRISLRRVVWFFALATSGVLADLLSKHFVFRHPEMFHGSEWWLWEGHLGIQKSLNEGALGGIGQGNVWFFASLSIAAAVAIPVWLFWYRAARDFWLTTALGCVLGGVVGNLYDRLGFSGLRWDRFDPSRTGEKVYAVRDFILMQWDERWVWPNYNIADSLLIFGAGLLLVQSTFTGNRQSSNELTTANGKSATAE
ncbi:MAG: signal peptidase II [Planctomycetes bacterium]|nr:signal peptidase II [Planctomycetota bacterium]